MDRAQYLIGGISRDTPVLEIGPSYNPILTKADGWSVSTVDHACKRDIENKYRAWGIDVSRVEEIDFIWSEGPLHQSVPRRTHGCYGRIIASHVIEHIPDLLDFLQSASILLTQEGSLALAVPDRRFCFDYFRPATLTSDILDRHGANNSRHTLKSAFETYFYSAKTEQAITWWNEPTKPVTLQHDWVTAKAQWEAYRNANASTYVDMHASSFTPCSFELIITELAALDLCDLSVQQIFLTNAFEFFVVLERAGHNFRDCDSSWLESRRTKLLYGMLEETHLQVEMLRRSISTTE